MSKFLSGLVLVLAAAFASGAQAQEIEPNDPCGIAQDFGSPALPAFVFGELSSTPGTPDVDFFRFTLAAGQMVQVDLEGSSTGQGTLGDPYLGLFDSSCTLVAVNDDSAGLNSRLIFPVPADGIIVLGATNCCDGEFLGGGQGSYRLSVSPLAAIGSIGGRIVDGNTGEALPGFDFPFATAQLLRCDPALGCFEFVNFQQADNEGRFLFTTDQAGNPLSAGAYQVLASASGYENLFSEQFDVAEGENFELGDLSLTPFQLIGSVTGRVVDAVTGDPLTGSGPPFPVIYLERCDGGGCFVIAIGSPDGDGRFSFDGALYFIPPGTFRLRGTADDYREAISPPFAVGAFEHYDAGEFGLTPLPIQFGAVRECQITAGGGLCEYGIVATNRGPGRYRGEAWSTVDLFVPNEVRPTRFQVGNVGTANPMPQRLNLKQGQTALLKFQLPVPGSVPEGTLLCATVTVGPDPTPQFHSTGDRFVFCAVKQYAGFEALSDKEGRKRYRESLARGARPAR